MAILAFLSIGLVLYDFFNELNKQRILALNNFDFAIAVIFLTDFLLSTRLPLSERITSNTIGFLSLHAYRSLILSRIRSGGFGYSDSLGSSVRVSI